MPNAKERKRDRRGLLVEQLARTEVARDLQHSLLTIPLLRDFIAKNVRWSSEESPRGGTAVVATLDRNYALPPIPESRRDALDALLEEHIGGLLLLPATRRAKARALRARVEELLTAPAPEAANAPELEGPQSNTSPLEVSRLPPAAPAAVVVRA